MHVSECLLTLCLKDNLAGYKFLVYNFFLLELYRYCSTVFWNCVAEEGSDCPQPISLCPLVIWFFLYPLSSVTFFRMSRCSLYHQVFLDYRMAVNLQSEVFFISGNFFHYIFEYFPHPHSIILFPQRSILIMYMLDFLLPPISVILSY